MDEQVTASAPVAGSRIAVVGSGISGNLAARMLSNGYRVTVFEAAPYIGGHANTVDIEAFGARYSVDTGFMVFNRRTYPNFCRMLELLEVSSRESDMSFSVRCDRTGLEYEGSDLNGVFAQRRNVLRPRFLRMLRDILRFNRVATAAAESDQFETGQTVGDFIRQYGLGDAFVQQYFVPMTAAIWSAKPDAILQAPAKFMIGFCRNHGLLQLVNRPRWRTILGGSRSYVEALLSPLGDAVRTGCPVEHVVRREDGVRIVSRAGEEDFDYVVFATHADQTLRMLGDDATSTERQLLTAFPYQANDAVLHTDESLMPRSERAWASWNYHIPCDEQETVSVTYDLSRLQGHDSPSPILLTLNRTQDIDPDKILRTFDYHHPAYSIDSIDAQRRAGEINGRRRSFFCGAYWGYGFHEDGVNSALAVAKYFHRNLESCIAASIPDESLTTATVR